MAPPGLILRPGEARDAAAVARLQNLLGAASGGTGRAMTAEIVARDLLSGAWDRSVLVAEAGGAVVGVATHATSYESAWAARGRYLEDLVVDPDHRGRGIARALVARLCRITAEEGGTYLTWLNGDELSGRGLYRELADVEERLSVFAITRERFRALAARG